MRPAFSRFLALREDAREPPRRPHRYACAPISKEHSMRLGISLGGLILIIIIIWLLFGRG
jgi:hypothetical protein